MAFIDEYDFSLLKNEAEFMVIREVENQLNSIDFEVCKCNECIVDMVAIALNTVKPLYRFSLLGTLYASQAMTEESYAGNIRDAVAMAIKKVKNNPAHN